MLPEPSAVPPLGREPVPKLLMLGGLKTVQRSVPIWPRVLVLLSRRPAPGVGGTLDTGSAMADTEGTGNGGSWLSAGVGCSTRIETADSSRKAITPAETTMTGTALPAGWERKTAPARPKPVLTQSATSARPS